MKKVITYGTYDLLHHGHISLLKRAKALGDYLIVGITAEDFDRNRGKINVVQSLSERIEAVRETGIADEIIVEEYEGQKIDDILRYDIDIFTVGSDWQGKFDYLRNYCEVIYLERTKGISSTELRDERCRIILGLAGDSVYLNKFAREAECVSNVKVSAICTGNLENMSSNIRNLPLITDDYRELLAAVDAVYIHSKPEYHFEQAKIALNMGKHVLCESPMALKKSEIIELYEIAGKNNCILMEALKTAYATAYYRLLLLVKGGKLGEIVSVDATCTSLIDSQNMTEKQLESEWNSINDWGPTALLPIFQILGVKYKSKEIVTHFLNEEQNFDAFTRITFIYPKAVASLKVGKCIKSEGQLLISGTKGYIYVPAPWWKTDYFEIRFENQNENQRYFYPLEGEGIRYEVVDFAKAIEKHSIHPYIEKEVSEEICAVMEDFNERSSLVII